MTRTLIALNRFTGDVMWETALDDWRKNYAASSAPLPAGNLIISGVTGGEHGANGFVAAHDQADRQGSLAILDGPETR